MQDKKTFITIVVLLVMCLPMTIFGTIKHFKDSSSSKVGTKIVDDNPNKDFIYNNKVYFYDNNKLLGVYDCSNCSEVKTTINDTLYHTNYFKYGDYKINNILSNNMALFNEGNIVNYYNIVAKQVIVSYDAIKNYNYKNNLDMTLVESNNKWGALALEVFPPVNYFNIEYDYLAIPAHFDSDGLLDASKLIAKKNNLWQVIDTNNVDSFSSMYEIVDFNDRYYITYDNGYNIIDNAGTKYLETLEKKFVSAIGEYIGVVINNNLLIYKDLNNNPVKIETLNDYSDLYFKTKEKKIEIFIDGKSYKTIEINE